MLRALLFACLFAASSAFQLVPRLALTHRVVAPLRMADDGCELVTLESYASAVFRRKYQHEAWVCPASEVASLQAEDAECLQVMHRGNIVWACSVDPIKMVPRDTWVRPDDAWKTDAGAATEEVAEAANDAIIERIKAALPKIKLPSLFRRSMWNITK